MIAKVKRVLLWVPFFLPDPPKGDGTPERNVVEHLLPIGQGKTRSWQQYLLDSVLAFLGTMLVTGFIAVFQLYPRITNISIAYLLVVLALASTRGRYASILASLVAFLSRSA